MRNENRLTNFLKLFSLILLILTIVISPHLVGGVTGRITWGIGVFSALSLACVWVGFSNSPKLEKHVHTLLLVVFLAWCWTWAHYLPFPCFIVEIIQPERVAEVFDSMTLLERPLPYWCSLSIDPGATIYKIIQASICLSVFVATWILVIHGHRKKIFLTVCISAFLVAVSSLTHQALEARSLYGLYEPKFMSQVFGPILNANNASGFFLMTLPLVGSFCFNEKLPLRLLGFTTSLLLMICILLSLSRWGIAVLFAITILFILTFLLQKKGSFSRRKFSHVVPTFLGVFVLALGFYVGQDRIFEEYQRGDLTKFETVEAGMRLLDKNPLLGVGRGGFSAAFVKHEGTSLRYEYAENFLIQWFVEWGILFTVFWISLITFFFVRRWLRSKNLQIKASLLGLAILMIQNLLDFSLENTAIALTASVLLAVIGASPNSKPLSILSFPISTRRFSFVLSFLVLCTVIFLGAKLPNSDVYSQAEKLKSSYEQADRRTFKRQLAQAIRLHPAEPLFPYFAGAEAVKQNDPRALKWLSRTMSLAPKWDGPHQQVAIWLWNHEKKEQAMLEVRQVAKLHLRHGYQLFCRLENQVENLDHILIAAPKDGNRYLFFQNVLARCTRQNLTASKELIRLILEEEPENEDARIRKIQQQLSEKKYWEALFESEIGLGFNPKSFKLYLEKSRVHNVLKQYELSILSLTEAQKHGATKEIIIARRATTFALMKNTDAMRTELERYLALKMTSPSDIAKGFEFKGDLERIAGNVVQSIKEYERAYEIKENDRILRKIGLNSNSIGLKNKAFRAFRILCQKKMSLESDCKQLEQLKLEQKKQQDTQWKRTFEKEGAE